MEQSHQKISFSALQHIKYIKTTIFAFP